MTDWNDVARRLSARELKRPALAYGFLTKAIAEHDFPLPLSDRDLVAASQHALRLPVPEVHAATVALEELAFRLASDEPIESIERAA